MSRLSLFRVALAACAFPAVLLSTSVAASAQHLPQRELRSLSAAIEEVRQGPFHGFARREWSGDAWVASRGHPWRFTGAGRSDHPEVRRETPPEDSVPGLSTGKVLLGALATSIPANAGAVALMVKGGYSPRESASAYLLILGGAVTGVAGPAIGARLAGGGFMPGLLGSVVGIGLGGLAVGAIGDDRGVHAAVLFSVFSLVHAGITTLFVVKAEQYAAAGR